MQVSQDAANYQKWLTEKTEAMSDRLYTDGDRLRSLYTKAANAQLARQIPISGMQEKILDAALGRQAYAEWMIGMIETGKLLVEDIPQVKGLLERFDKHKSKLETKDRHILSYKKWQDLIDPLERAIGEAEIKISAKTRAARARVLASDEAIIVGEGSKYKAVLLRSVHAAIAFETNMPTQWCTSYTDSPNYFYYYAMRGPVIDLIDETGRVRYGICFGANHINTQKNEDIPYNEIHEADPELWATLEPYFTEALRRGGMTLNKIPHDLRSAEMCLAAVSHSADQLDHVPMELRKKEICHLAVSKNGQMLRLVPLELRTPELCQVALEQTILATPFAHLAGQATAAHWVRLMEDNHNFILNYIPEDVQTDEFYENILAIRGMNIEHVPPERLTDKMKMIAVQNDGMVLAKIHVDERTKELCEAAVANNGWVLDSVPTHLLTSELCLVAVKECPRSITKVPEKYLTEDIYVALAEAGQSHDIDKAKYTQKICDAMFRNWHGDFKNIPERFRSPEMCEAVTNMYSAELFYCIPDRMRTYELCLKMVRKNGIILGGLVNGFKTEEMCEAAVKSNGLALQAVPEHLKIKELCWQAVEDAGDALYYVPEDMRTQDMYERAFERGCKYISIVPDEFKTESIHLNLVKTEPSLLQSIEGRAQTWDICRAAVMGNAGALEFIKSKPEWITPLALEAVREEGRSLRDIPCQFLTYEICQEALKEDMSALEYVPREYMDEAMWIRMIENGGVSTVLLPAEMRDKEMVKYSMLQRRAGMLRTMADDDFIMPYDMADRMMRALGWGIGEDGYMRRGEPRPELLNIPPVAVAPVREAELAIA